MYKDRDTRYMMVAEPKQSNRINVQAKVVRKDKIAGEHDGVIEIGVLE